MSCSASHGKLFTDLPKTGLNLRRSTSSKLSVSDALDAWAIAESRYETGIYSHQPWYTPTLAGYRETSIPVTDEQAEAAAKIGKIVQILSKSDSQGADALRCFCGAFVGGRQLSKKQRFNLFRSRHGIQMRDYYRIVNSARRYVEGAWAVQ